MSERPQLSCALDGVRVVDVSTLLPGHLCTRTLHELGATVITVERPGVGDSGRSLTPHLFDACNGGKLSVAIDLKSANGRRDLERLVRASDVVVHNYRAATAERLGLGYDRLREVNETLVCCLITGYGLTGQDSARAAHNLLIEALFGLVTDADPAVEIPGIPMADLAAALYATAGIAAALYARRAAGEGCLVDIPLVRSAAGLLGARLTEAMNAGEADSRKATRPGMGVFRASDGVAIAIAAIENHFWSALAGAAGVPERDGFSDREASWGDDAKALEAAIAQRDSAWWLDLGEQIDVPMQRVHSPSDLSDDAILLRTGSIALHDGEVRFGSPFMTASSRPAAPALGADTARVLAALDGDAGLAQITDDRMVR